MRVLKSILVPAALAALLAACGGSERVEDYVPTKLVAFGDELSVINSDGSKHGVNALKTNSTELDCATYPVWPQAVASGYGLVFPQCNSSGVLTTSAEMKAVAGAKVADRVPGLSGLAMAVAIAAVAVAPIGLSGVIEGMTSTRIFLLALATALLASVIPYSLELRALRSLSPAAFGILLSLEPAVATLAGWLVLRQHIGPAHLIAMALVIGASVGSTLTAPRPSPPVPSS